MEDSPGTDNLRRNQIVLSPLPCHPQVYLSRNKINKYVEIVVSSETLELPIQK